MDNTSVAVGRPTDSAGRSEVELRVYDFLDSLGIEYRRADHAVAASMEQLHEADRILGVRICKNLFLCNRQQTDFYLLSMPADKPFHTRDLSAQIGSSRLSFGDEEHMERYLGTHPGSVSIMGLMNDREGKVKLLMDSELLGREWFGCHPCVNTTSLRMHTKDILEKFLPAVGHVPFTVVLPNEP